MTERWLYVCTTSQRLYCYSGGIRQLYYTISTAINGLGEQNASECTPRGWHYIYKIIGMDAVENSVFVSRKFTGEIYTPSLAAAIPQRDWIITRIFQLSGLEPGINQGGTVDTLQRYIYIHGTPDTMHLGTPKSHGCIRMCSADIIALSSWVAEGTRVFIL